MRNDRLTLLPKQFLLLNFQRGHDDNVSFLSKSQLVEHYEKTLGAFHFGGRIMIIETKSALKLINKYFQNK